MDVEDIDDPGAGPNNTFDPTISGGDPFKGT